VSGTRNNQVSRRAFLRTVGAGALAATASAGLARSAPVKGSPLLPSVAATPTPKPTWDSSFKNDIAAKSMGYVYAIAQNGSLVEAVGVALSRGPNEKTNPNQSWTPDTLSNLFSVSKAIAAVGFMTIVAQQGTSLLDQTFWPILANSGRFTDTPATGVDSITIRQLLTHYSGLGGDESALYTTSNGQANGGPPQPVDQWLMTFLQEPLASAPGSTYHYSNQNFTVIQVLTEILAGAPANSYAQWIKDTVFTPMGIDTTGEITDVRSPDNQVLYYSGPDDTRPGHLQAAVPLIAAGGWLGTANGVLKFLLGLRANTVLDAPTTQMMFTQQIGWFSDSSIFGSYFHKTGGGTNYTDQAHTLPSQQLHSAVAVLPGGFDAVLMANSPIPGLMPVASNLVGAITNAFGAPPPLRD